MRKRRILDVDLEHVIHGEGNEGFNHLREDLWFFQERGLNPYERLQDIVYGVFDIVRGQHNTFFVCVEADVENTEESFEETSLRDVETISFLLRQSGFDCPIKCSICGKDIPEFFAHWHQEDWVADYCCWDERPKNSE